MEFLEINGARVLIQKFRDKTVADMKNIVDDIKAKEDNAVVVLALENSDSLNFVAGVAKNLVTKIKAGDIIKELASQTSGKGGGRPDFAQGGGKDVEKLDTALNHIRKYIENLV